MSIAKIQGQASTILGARGVILEEVVAMAPQIEAGEILTLCGSVAEGLANKQSDVDLMYVGRGTLRGKFSIAISGVSAVDVAHTGGGCEVNVERVDPERIAMLGDDFLPALDSITDQRSGKALSFILDPLKLQILHRLRVAVPLHGHDAYKELYDRLRLEQLPMYLAAIALQDYMNAREDVDGEIEIGSSRSAVWMATRIAAPRLLAATLAAVDQTVIKEKWHMKILLQNEEAVGFDLTRAFIRFLEGGADQDPVLVLRDLIELEEKALPLVFSRFPKLYRAIKMFSMRVRYYAPKSTKAGG